MTELTKYTELKRICAYALDQMQKNSLGNLDRAWIFGFRGLVDMGFEISFEPKTVRLPIQNNKTVIIPADNIGITKVGLLDNNGLLSSLRIDNALTTWRDTDPQRLQDLTPNISDSIANIGSAAFFFNYFINGNYYNLYGTQTGLVQYGSCRVDEANGVIVLPPDFQYDSVLVEYISSPEKDNDYKIETCLQEALIEWIRWKFGVGSDKEYYAALIKGRRRLTNKKFTLSKANQVIRESVAMKILM